MIRYIGLSEVSAATSLREHAVHPTGAVEVEYSPFNLKIEDPKAWDRERLLRAWNYHHRILAALASHSDWSGRECTWWL